MTLTQMAVLNLQQYIHDAVHRWMRFGGMRAILQFACATIGQ